MTRTVNPALRVVPATSYAGYFSGAFPDLRRRRDIVVIDQRGGGASNALGRTCRSRYAPMSCK